MRGSTNATHLDSEVVSLGMPEHLDVSDAEEIFLTQLNAVRHAHEADARWQVAACGLHLVHSHDGCCWAPAEVLHTGMWIVITSWV